MKKISVLMIAAFLWCAPAQARQNQAHERIHAAKTAYVTERLQLSTTQLATFIPLYSEYEQEIKTARRTFMKKYKGTEPTEATDAMSKQYIDDNLDYQQQVIEIKRKYNDRFLKVITPQQLAGLYPAEREFKQLLLKKLNNKRANDGMTGGKKATHK